MKNVDLDSNDERFIIDFSVMGLKNVVLLGHYVYKEVKSKLEMHQHRDMLEICYLETGSQYYQVDDTLYLLKGGDLLITRPNVIHGTSGYPEEKGSLFWMIIKVPKGSFKLLNLTPSESRLLCERLLNLKKIHFSGSSEIKKILITIFEIYYRKDDFINKLEISNLILRFLLRVVQLGESTNFRDFSTDIEYCRNYIDNNPFQKVFISSLAKEINLSESRFKHKFKEEIGIPPNEYIIKRKIMKAKELLERSDISITNLAYDLNFSSSAYFSTVFKKYQGVTPTEFRNGPV